jgi:hypothetical protein
MKISLLLDRDTVRPGDWVTGSVSVSEGGKARSIEVAIRYAERSIDYIAYPISITSAPLHEGDIADGLLVPFALAIPGHAMPSCRGQFGSLEWNVWAKVDRMGPDATDWAQLDVTPSAPASGLPPFVEGAARAGAVPRPGLGAPAAWYADPRGVARLRYYDGMSWTDRTAA